MMVSIYDPTGDAFFGSGYWGKKVFWLNIPAKWREMDEYDYLQKMLNTWGSLGEEFLYLISELTSQRDPYKVRTKNSLVRWFYVTESISVNDDVYGKIIRLVGEKNPSLMPSMDADKVPSDLKIMREYFPWYPYEPLKDVACYWHMYKGDTQYDVVNTRLRNYDPVALFTAHSLANEVWVKGGDLVLTFDYKTDRLWNIDVEDSLIQGTVTIGVTDGSQRPSVKVNDVPLRLMSNVDSSSMLTDDANIIVAIPVNGDETIYLYDVQDSIDENIGTLNFGESGIISNSVCGHVNYLTGMIDIDLSEIDKFSDVSGKKIKIKYKVRGYYLRFNAPPLIDYLAQDFGFNNDHNDPEDVQRSTIANITKFWGIKSTQDSYRIRGEISLFSVYMQGLFRICSAELALKIPSSSVYEIDGKFYTDTRPVYIKYDHIAANQVLYDMIPPYDEIAITDNGIIGLDDTRADGLSIGQAFALDVTQGYFGKISPVNSNVRGPAVVDTVTPLTQKELELYRWDNGYRYDITMRRCQYDAFNLYDGHFALSVYEYDEDPSLGTPPNINDPYYYIESIGVVPWVLDSSPTADPMEDIGTWSVLLRFGKDVISPIAEGDSVAVRYLPNFDFMDCCYCRSHNMRAVLNATDEAYDFYDTYEKVDNAIERMKKKIQVNGLVPIHANVIEWEVTRLLTDIMYGVQNGATVVHGIGGDRFESNFRVYVSVYYRGISLDASQSLDFEIVSEDSGSVWSLAGYYSSSEDIEEWVTVVEDEEIDDGNLLIGGNISLNATSSALSSYGDVKWIFRIIRMEK